MVSGTPVLPQTNKSGAVRKLTVNSPGTSPLPCRSVGCTNSPNLTGRSIFTQRGASYGLRGGMAGGRVPHSPEVARAVALPPAGRVIRLGGGGGGGAATLRRPVERRRPDCQ